MQSTSTQVGDGCTGWFDGNWRECCDIHDLAYAAQEISKALADSNLADCVASVGHSLIMAFIMWLGVTIFGGFFYNRARKKAAMKSKET